MTKKILVAYATRAGSTAEIAQAIGQTLTAQGAAVDVLPLKQVTDLPGYDAVVMGSAIRFGMVLPEVKQFIEQNSAVLNQKAIAFFAVHLMNQGDNETSHAARLAYLDPIRKLVSPRAEAFFTGVGDMAKVSLIERMIGHMVKSPEGDFRDWALIHTWAESLQAVL